MVIDMPIEMIRPNCRMESKISSGQMLNFIKQDAYQIMGQLEGWCSLEKAAILIDLIMMTDAMRVVEIGVFGGKSLLPMALVMKHKGYGRCYGIDPWSAEESLVGMEDQNADWWGSLDHEQIYQGLLMKIKQFGLSHEIRLIRETSANASEITDIDILHIDGNHSEVTSMIDVTKWVPLVRKGGFIIFDDMNWATQKRAVEWLDEHCTKIAEFEGDNIWGIWVKP